MDDPECVHLMYLKVKIKSVLTVREENGLAMSSRNFLLDKKTRYDARIIYESLCMAKGMIKTNDISEIKFYIGELFLMNKNC